MFLLLQDLIYIIIYDYSILNLHEGIHIVMKISTSRISMKHNQIHYFAAKLQLNEDGVKTGLVLEPCSQCIVMNSHPGHLQFYSPEQSKLWMEVGNSLFYSYVYVGCVQHDVTELNYVSRTFGKALVLTTADHVSFSPDGSWMATVRKYQVLVIVPNK